MLTSVASASNPRGCKDVGVYFPSASKNLVLTPSLDANVFLIHNKSWRQHIELERVLQSNNPIVVKLTTQLRPYAWTSLALDRPSIEFSCFVTRQRHHKPVQHQVSCIDSKVKAPRISVELIFPDTILARILLQPLGIPLTTFIVDNSDVISVIFFDISSSFLINIALDN